MKFKALKHKYGAVRCEIDGMKFDSKFERSYYIRLVNDMASSNPTIAMFLRQVPFHLPGGIKYVCDFQVFYLDGTVDFVDCKGMDTTLSKTKRTIVETLYPVKITIITKV